MSDKQKSSDPEKVPAKKAQQDDEVAGKAYDGRLMRRLLTYLRPYKLQTAFSAISTATTAPSFIITHSVPPSSRRPYATYRPLFTSRSALHIVPFETKVS